MVRDSKNRTKEIKQFAKAITLLKSNEEAGIFLRDLLTPQELNSISTRLEIARRLYQTNQSYREISRDTGVSTTTITRVYNWIARGEGGLMNLLKKMFGDSDKENTKNNSNKHHHKTKA